MFSRINEVLFMPDTNFFVTRFDTQLKQFVSWKTDPDAWFYNAFSRPWSDLVPYVFPPFSLISKVLAKIQKDRVQKAIVIAPLWSSSHWYPTLLLTLFMRPRLLPRRPDLLMLNRIELHPVKDSLILAAWPVSGNNSTSSISQRATDLVNSWRPGTQKQYCSAWQQYCRWCRTQQVDPL